MLTPVGILPIVLAGFDMKAMLEGALAMEEACAKKCECNPAIQYAAMRNALYNQGKKIEILVAYNPSSHTSESGGSSFMVSQRVRMALEFSLHQ